MSLKTDLSVGKINPITLPIQSVGPRLGERIAVGGFGMIHEVKDSNPLRVFKIIKESNFKNGDEIRITEIAGNCGVGPAYHGAFVHAQKNGNFVIIEMDHGGKSLGQHMEDLGEEPEPEPEPDIPEHIRAIQAKIQAECGFTVTAIKKKERVEPEVAIQHLYSDPEDFYFELFSKIKILVENHIAFRDTHVGNILPHDGEEEKLQLIDFDSATIEGSELVAKWISLNSMYTNFWKKRYLNLENPSEKSQQLIEWLSNTF